MKCYLKTDIDGIICQLKWNMSGTKWNVVSF